MDCEADREIERGTRHRPHGARVIGAMVSAGMVVREGAA